jgi:ribosomal 30S subunit maturation factor RimM
MVHSFVLQGSTTQRIMIASEKEHTETVVLMLANKADINGATKVEKFKIFKYL